MQTVSHANRRGKRCGPLHEADIFLAATIATALHGLSGRLAPAEALEQVVILGSRAERFLTLARGSR
jgi:hypothetical protein